MGYEIWDRLRNRVVKIQRFTKAFWFKPGFGFFFEK
jgi:hypothetical protein